MRLSQPEIESMQEDMTVDLLQMLVEDKEMTMQDAMALLYNSDTYSRLMNSASGLYYQSAGYVMDFLQNEITTGKCK